MGPPIPVSDTGDLQHGDGAGRSITFGFGAKMI